MLNYSSACERNQEPIRTVLADWISAPGVLLEIGAGSGQHALYLGAAFSQLRWQPTEVAALLPALRANLAQRPANVLEPQLLDVSQPDWPLAAADLVFTANTLHIIDWAAVVALIQGAAARLVTGGLLFVYGPMRYRGDYTAASNAEFDRWLRQRDPASGIRDFEALHALASAAGLHLREDRAMPANNQLLVWRKGERTAAKHTVSR